MPIGHPDLVHISTHRWPPYGSLETCGHLVTEVKTKKKLSTQSADVVGRHFRKYILINSRQLTLHISPNLPEYVTNLIKSAAH